MSQLDTIIKGSLTGEQVGRIFLRDFVRFIEAIQSEQTPPKDKFTEAEKQTMVDKLTDPYEIKQYNTYIGIIQFLQKLGIMYSEQHKQLRYLLLALLEQIEASKHLETTRLLLADAPLILTEPQYKRLKKEDLESKLAKETSVAGIILTATDYYFKKYQSNNLTAQPDIPEEEAEKHIKGIAEIEGNTKTKEILLEAIKTRDNKTPYNAIFEAYKDQPLTNTKFKNNYYIAGQNGHYESPDGETSKGLSDDEWTEVVAKWIAKKAETGIDYLKWVEDGREAPPDATKYDILEYLGGFFNIGEDTTKEDLETFKNDYPDIYEAILTELKGIKGLELDKIKPEDYTKPLITYKILYALNLVYYLEFFRFNPKDGDSFIAKFITVIPEEEIKHWHTWQKADYLDKDGNYRYQLKDYERIELTEHLPRIIDKVKLHLRYLLAIQEIYKILGEQLGEASITELAKDKVYFNQDVEAIKNIEGYGIPPNSLINWFIERINDDIEDFKRMLRKTSLVVDPETITKIHEAVNALEPIKKQSLHPTKESIEKAKELTKDLVYYGQQGLKIHDILMGIGIQNG